MDRASKEWDTVIKVKYGDTLRRFCAHVRGNSIDKNMDQLRARIINLFRFTPDADITLTYTDVDGDLVTLVNDDELLDAIIKQHLNPLRINVQLNATPAGTNNAEPSTGNSSEHLVQTHINLSPQPQSIEHVIAEAFKYVPEPLGAAVSKLSQDLVLKASASAPAISSIIDHFTKLGLSCASNLEGNLDVHVGECHVDQFSEKQPESGKSSEDLARESRAGAPPLSVINQGEHLKTNDNLSYVYDTSGFAVPIPNINNKVSAGIPFVPTSYKLESDVDSIRQTPLYAPVDPSRHVGVPHRRSHRHHNSSQCVFHRGVQCDGCGMLPITGPRYKSTMKDDYDLCSICFLEMGNNYEYIRMDQPMHFDTRSSRRFQNSVLHNMQGHGMRPSKAKLNSQFINDVTILDGTVMPPSTPFTKIWKMRNNGNTHWPSGTHLIWIGGDKLSDATTVQLEITASGFPAGGEMDMAVDFISPSQNGLYMSNWRLCSPSCQKFGQRIWVLIQVDTSLPSGVDLNNLPPCRSWNREDVIDLNTEPVENACHSGHLPRSVQVDMEYQRKDDPLEDIQSFPVNTNGMVDDDLIHDVLQTSSPSNNITRRKEHAVSYSLLDSPVTPPPHPPFVPYLAVVSSSFPGTSADATIGSSLNLSSKHRKISTESSPTVSSDLTTPVTPDGNTADSAEQALLNELHEMGFKQVDLNKEVLRMNEYDLEQSLNDLCGSSVGDWDPLLVELREMGFVDTEKNKKLLIKNGGSIKRVVLELIAGEKVCIDYPSSS